MQYANLASVIVELQNSAAQPARALAPQASQAFAQLAVGQAVTATIVRQLSSGLYLADIADQRLQLSLPIMVSPGDTLTLRLLRQDPEMAFELVSRGSAEESNLAPQGNGREPLTFSGAKGTPLIQASALQPAEPQTQLQAGQTVTATVVGKLATGVTVVDIDGRRLLLELPASAVPGDAVSLRVVKPEPEPAFEFLARFPGAGATLPPSLSAAAQIIQSALADTSAAPMATVKSAAPLVPVPPQPEQLAAALRDAIETSGMFYESHLAAWVQGQRPLAQLRREPQAAWHRNAAVSDESITSADNAPLPESFTAPETAMDIPEPLQPLLRQQLETLESQRIAWAGQVWPGQTASLVIAEEPPKHHETEQEPSSEWRTRLALSLPNLGDIRAELAVHGAALKISIGCRASESASRLQADLPHLEERLRAAGLQPLKLTVTGHD